MYWVIALVKCIGIFQTKYLYFIEFISVMDKFMLNFVEGSDVAFSYKIWFSKIVTGYLKT